MIKVKEYSERIKKLQEIIVKNDADGALITSNPNLFYFTGAVTFGYLYVPREGKARLFVKLPLGLENENITYIRSPRQLPKSMTDAGYTIPKKLLLEDGDISAAEFNMLVKLFDCEAVSATSAIRTLRSKKSDHEIELIIKTAEMHAKVYEKIGALYKSGMTDREFSAEIEYRLRLSGHPGLFRTFGFRMEAHMGSVLAGDNAAAPSPFDFALGGRGESASFPLGPCGEPLKKGQTILVDLSGNLFGYLTDMSRTYSVGELPDEAYRAHEVSIKIQEETAKAGIPGARCCDLYSLATQIAKENGLEDCFMGKNQRAKFVGHGLGIEINEPPVLAPRMDTPLEENMVIALEPKFIIDSVGAVGTENTYVVRKGGLEKMTIFREDIINLCI